VTAKARQTEDPIVEVLRVEENELSLVFDEEDDDGDTLPRSEVDRLCE
jgi:hypothetical protein